MCGVDAELLFRFRLGMLVEDVDELVERRSDLVGDIGGGVEGEFEGGGEQRCREGGHRGAFGTCRQRRKLRQEAVDVDAAEEERRSVAAAARNEEEGRGKRKEEG